MPLPPNRVLIIIIKPSHRWTLRIARVRLRSKRYNILITIIIIAIPILNCLTAKVIFKSVVYCIAKTLIYTKQLILFNRFSARVSDFEQILQNTAYIIIEPKLSINRGYNIYKNQLFNISFRSHIFRSDSEIIVKYEFNYAADQFCILIVQLSLKTINQYAKIAVTDHNDVTINLPSCSYTVNDILPILLTSNRLKKHGQGFNI